jgi:hypothetical protein
MLIKQLCNMDKQMGNKAIVDEDYKRKWSSIWETRIPATYSLICSLYDRGKFFYDPQYT